MTKFQVGERVKVVKDLVGEPTFGKMIGRQGRVKQLGGKQFEVLVALDDSVGPLWFEDDELEAVNE